MSVIEFFMPHEVFGQIREMFFVHSGLTWRGGDSVDITAITQADPAVVTAVGHGLEDGDKVRITEVTGMTEINSVDEPQSYTIANKTADTFELSGVDSAAWTAYSSGGIVEVVANSISGLPGDVYPDGKEIQVLGDGIYCYVGKVYNGGISFPFYANVIHAGLPYETVIEPLNPSTQTRQGVSRGKKQKINRVTLCFYDSIGCKIGIDRDHLFDLYLSDPLVHKGVIEAPYFTSGILSSDDMTVDLQGEWDDEASISIVHDKPVAFTLNAVVAHITVNDEP